MEAVCPMPAVRPQQVPPPVSLPGLYPNRALGPRGMLDCLQVFRPPVMPFKALTELSNRLSLCSLPTPSTMCFSQEELDYVLYGCISNTPRQTYPRHALSGLRLSDMANEMGRMWNKGNMATLPLYPPWRTSRLDPPPHVLPEELCIYPTMFAGVVHYGVFCRKEVIPTGTRYGPFKGKIVNTSEIKTFDDNTHMWEIFKNGRLSHFVDGRGALGSWMSYVNCARHKSEQNLVVVQQDDEIFYEVSRDIHNGCELLVWYGETYLQFMGIPVTLHDVTSSESSLPTEESENSDGYQCERCGKVFAYKYYRDKHLKYTKCVDQGDRKFPCHLCSRSFEKRDRLRIHVLHVHEKHRPHKCAVCGKSFSQSSSLNKHMRVHSGERPYKCVYCSKAFTASSILRTHIRQHSGERPFKCKYCGKAFASHAAHDSHVRRTHSRDKPLSCKLCGLEFQHQFDLKLHYRSHSEGEPICSDVMWSDPNAASSPVDVVQTS